MHQREENADINLSKENTITYNQVFNKMRLQNDANKNRINHLTNQKASTR